MNIKRNCTDKLKKALLRSPVVLLTGARQTGKTTLAKEIALEQGYYYITFDNLSMLAAAQADPQGFIENLQKPVIIDEAQRAPELFYAIKKNVDENRTPGAFFLTGSTNPLFIPRIGDALVGRIEIIELQPFSQGELLSRQEHFIDTLFDNKQPNKFGANLFEYVDKKTLFQKIITGGYPLAQNIDEEARTSWFDSYITTLLYRDVQELAHVTGLIEFPNLLRVLATRTGNLANVAEIGRSATLPTTTLNRYLALLQALFLLNFQPPWSGNLNKRFVKAPKIYLNDTGLLSFLLAASPEKMATNVVPTGGMLENFVVSELKRQMTWNLARVISYHFRTPTGIEVDIVLEHEDGRCAGIEIKTSDTVNKHDFKGLIHLQELLGDKMCKGIVLYTGSQAIPFGKNLWALPISALWSL